MVAPPYIYIERERERKREREREREREVREFVHLLRQHVERVVIEVHENQMRKQLRQP